MTHVDISFSKNIHDCQHHFFFLDVAFRTLNLDTHSYPVFYGISFKENRFILLLKKKDNYVFCKYTDNNGIPYSVTDIVIKMCCTVRTRSIPESNIGRLLFKSF